MNTQRRGLPCPILFGNSSLNCDTSTSTPNATVCSAPWQRRPIGRAERGGRVSQDPGRRKRQRSPRFTDQGSGRHQARTPCVRRAQVAGVRSRRSEASLHAPATHRPFAQELFHDRAAALRLDPGLDRSLGVRCGGGCNRTIGLAAETRVPVTFSGGHGWPARFRPAGGSDRRCASRCSPTSSARPLAA